MTLKRYIETFQKKVNESRLANEADPTRHHEVTDRLNYLIVELQCYAPGQMFRTQKDVDEFESAAKEYKKIHHFAEEWELDVSEINSRARGLLKKAEYLWEKKH